MKLKKTRLDFEFSTMKGKTKTILIQSSPREDRGTSVPFRKQQKQVETRKNWDANGEESRRLKYSSFANQSNR